MCKAIGSIYKSIFGIKLDPNILENQIKLQKSIYLIENMGIRVGNYDFVWSKYGPYSPDLQRDILSAKTDSEVQFSSKMIDAINFIKEILEEEVSYNEKERLEMIASLHFIKVCEYNTFINDELVLKLLRERKKYLSNIEENKKGLEIVNQKIIV